MFNVNVMLNITFYLHISNNIITFEPTKTLKYRR
jgi:hypothetical protein